MYHGPGKISLDDVPVPKIIEPDDAIVRVTTSTICGTDIHIQHGGMPAVEPGRVIGHEFVGEIVEIGPNVKSARVGDRGRRFLCYTVRRVFLLPATDVFTLRVRQLDIRVPD